MLAATVAHTALGGLHASIATDGVQALLLLPLLARGAVMAVAAVGRTGLLGLAAVRSGAADPDPDKTMDPDDLLGHLDRWAQRHHADARERALETFRTSTRYEYMFWEQAWPRQEWPV